MCETTIENLRWALEQDVPIFGICLGNQLMARAAGKELSDPQYGEPDRTAAGFPAKRAPIPEPLSHFCVSISTLYLRAARCRELCDPRYGKQEGMASDLL